MKAKKETALLQEQPQSYLKYMLKDFVSKTDSMAEKLTAFLKRDRRRVL